MEPTISYESMDSTDIQIVQKQSKSVPRKLALPAGLFLLFSVGVGIFDQNYMALVVGSAVGGSLLLFARRIKRNMMQDLSEIRKEVIEGPVQKKQHERKNKIKRYFILGEKQLIPVGEQTTFDSFQDGDVAVVKRTPHAKIILSITKKQDDRYLRPA